MTKNKNNILRSLRIQPEWIDHNGHMNVAYYVLVFDQSLDVLLEHIELTMDYRTSSGNTVYVLETHVCYLQEVKENDPIDITCRVIDVDDKRIHLYLEMHHAEDGFLAATSEQMIFHIDTSGPKAAAMPYHIRQNLETLKAEKAHLPLPEKLGSKIGIRRK